MGSAMKLKWSSRMSRVELEKGVGSVRDAYTMNFPVAFALTASSNEMNSLMYTQLLNGSDALRPAGGAEGGGEREMPHTATMSLFTCAQQARKGAPHMHTAVHWS